jgi:hypothetical protein
VRATTPNVPLPAADFTGEADKQHNRVKGKRCGASGASVDMQNGEGDGGSPQWLEPKRGEKMRGNGGPMQQSQVEEKRGGGGALG